MTKSINTQEKIFEIMLSTRVEHPIESVIDLATLYVNTGNLNKSAQGAGINQNTAKDWTKQQWFSDILDVVRYEHQKKLDGKITALLGKSLDELADRLDKGDVDSKTGERRPVNAAQVASIIGTLYDKRALIRGEPTSRVERVSVDQRLNKLHKRFEEIGKSQPVLIEGDIDNVEH